MNTPRAALTALVVAATPMTAEAADVTGRDLLSAQCDFPEGANLRQLDAWAQ